VVAKPEEERLAKLNRDLLQRLSDLRVQEAKCLLGAELFDGAYYLVGYAVECALKACVTKQIQQYDFPDKKLTEEVYTHNLERLVKAAGLWQEWENARKADSDLSNNWAVVKDWSETHRYEAGTTESLARDMFSACASEKNGVLIWIKSQW
jgi:hypothetical protein